MTLAADYHRRALVQLDVIELRTKTFRLDDGHDKVQRAVAQTRQRHARKSFDKTHARVGHLFTEDLERFRQYR